jgi:hypothetical protein
MGKVVKVLQDSFYQLSFAYAVFIFLIALGYFWKYALQFQIFAVIVAIFGIFILGNHEDGSEGKEIKISKKFHNFLFALGILIIFFSRAYPYFNQDIPLGYDTGIYRYSIEHGLSQGEGWIYTTLTPGFLYLMEFLKLFFGVDFILKWVLIFFCVLTGIGVYFLIKEYSNKTAGLIGLFAYCFSIIQFRVFSMMYFKNIVAFPFLLFSIYFLRRYEKTKNKRDLVLFIVLGGLMGTINRPAFFIFGLSYIIYCFVSSYGGRGKYIEKLAYNLFYGLMMIFIFMLFYSGKFSKAVTSLIGPVAQSFVETGQDAGTFINFFTFQFSSLFYLPFALLGLFYFLRKRQVNFLVIWAVINAAIVYFQFFFFNRFIAYLGLVLIILSALGFYAAVKERKIGWIVLILLLFSSSIFFYKEIDAARPLISNSELNAIRHFEGTEENSFVMSLSSVYSPWIVGYSQRRTIAPGLFDYDNHSQEEWMVFWYSNNITEIRNFLDIYEKPLYIFSGVQHRDILAGFPECFEVYYENEGNKIYKYIC